MKPKQHVFPVGAPRTHIHIVWSGVVGTYKVLIDGRRQLVAFTNPGEFVDLEMSVLAVTRRPRSLLRTYRRL